MTRPPRDPKAAFVGRRMLTGVIAGGLTLALLAGGAFLFAYPSLGLGAARSLALGCWLVGHAVLGIAMGWERRAFGLSDLRANPAILLWAAGAVALAVLVLLLPPFAAILQAGAVPLRTAAIAAAVSAVVPLWLEVPKRLSRRPG